MGFSFTGIGLTETDDADTSADQCETQHMQSIGQIANGYKPPFGVRMTHIFRNQRIIEIEFRRLLKRQ